MIFLLSKPFFLTSAKSDTFPHVWLYTETKIIRTVLRAEKCQLRPAVEKL